MLVGDTRSATEQCVSFMPDEAPVNLTRHVKKCLNSCLNRSINRTKRIFLLASALVRSHLCQLLPVEPSQKRSLFPEVLKYGKNLSSAAAETLWPESGSFSVRLEFLILLDCFAFQVTERTANFVNI